MKGNKKDMVSGCLFGLALGDGWGYTNEFLSYSKIKSKWGPMGLQQPREGVIKVSDDTQMTIAVGRAIQKAYVKEQIDKNEFENKLVLEFINWYSDQTNDRDPGKTILNVCEKLAKGENWKNVTSLISKGSGANMRVTPIGLLSVKSKKFDEPLLGKLAQFQSAITHAHPTALAASELTAICIHRLVNDISPDLLLEGLFDYCEKNKNQYHSDWLGDLWKRSGFDSYNRFISMGWEECGKMLTRVKHGLSQFKHGQDPCSFTGDGWVADQALGTALLSFLLDPSDSVGALRKAINTNGDSDTIGCIAGALTGAYNGIDSLPKDWIDELEYRDEINQRINFFISD